MTYDAFHVIAEVNALALSVDGQIGFVEDF